MRTYVIGGLIALGAAVSLVSRLAGVATPEDKSAQVDALPAGAAQDPASDASVQKPQMVKLDPKVYEVYVGRYRLAGPDAILNVTGATLTLTSARGRLFVEGRPGKAEMVPESEVTFRVPVCNATVTFVRNSTGEVSHAIINLIRLAELTATPVK